MLEIKSFEGLLTSDVDDKKLCSLIQDSYQLAALFAPCIESPDFAHHPKLDAIIRQAIIKFLNSGEGVISSESLGPSTISYTQYSNVPQLNQSGVFTSQDVRNLKALCTQNTKKVQTLAMFTERPCERWDRGLPFAQN